MATEIVPGVFQLVEPLPYNPPGAINIYLLRGEDGYLLIDTGWNSDQAFRALGDELDNIGADFKEIRQIVVTHAHPDHYGLVGKVHELSKAKIYMHHSDEEIFQRYSASEEYLRQSEAWFNRNGVPPREIPFTRLPSSGQRAIGLQPQPYIHLDGGETISNGAFDLKVIWTPGHTPGHISLYESRHKLLFAGDLVLPVIIPNVSLPPNSTGNPLSDFLKSLELVRDLDVANVLPGHGSLLNNLKKRIDEITRHRTVRNAEILKGLGTGLKSAYEISNLITWMPEYGGVKFRDLMPMDQRAAVSETLAHLRALTVDGMVKITAQDNMYYYECLEK